MTPRNRFRNANHLVSVILLHDASVDSMTTELLVLSSSPTCGKHQFIKYEKFIGVWWVFGGCLVGVWWVFGWCLVGAWWVFGGCLVGVWWVFGGCLVGVWWVFGGCLV